MVKKENIKSEFEREARLHLSRGWVDTYYGKKPLHSITIDIEYASRDKFFVSLVTRVNECYGVTQLRSYPMSYKSAYRLVCSL